MRLPSHTKDHFLLPQIGEIRFIHELPLVELCNGLIAGAVDGGFERLDVLAPGPGAAIAEIRAYTGQGSSQYFELPASIHPRVVRRFKAMAKMRRARPADVQGTIRFSGVGRKPIDIRVILSLRPDGQADVCMTLPAHES